MIDSTGCSRRFSLSLTFFSLLSIGIFGYLNYLVKRDRRFIADILINGLHRLEYRGYDSSGIAFDGNLLNEKRACLVVRQKGKVEELEHAVKCKKKKNFFHFHSSE